MQRPPEIKAAMGGVGRYWSAHQNVAATVPRSESIAAICPIPRVNAPLVVDAVGSFSRHFQQYYSQGSGTITNVWKTEVTISFATDGTVSGSAGCDDYQGTWSVSGGYDEFESGVPDPNDGQVLILGSLTWSAVECDDEAIMEQEAEILDLLQRGNRWVLIRENFNLRDAEGKFLFEAEHA